MTVAAGLVLALCSSIEAFVGVAPRSNFREVARTAEGESSSSVALVKVTEENTLTTAGVLAGTAGLLVGGIWVGGALFAVSSYIARRPDDDLAKALKGVSTGSLEAINFLHTLDKKYSVTDKLGSAITDAIEKAKTSPDTKEVAGVVNTVGDAITNFDKDVGIKDSLGSILTAGGDLANKAVEKLVELNDQYKVTDQIKAKIEEVTKST